MKCLNVGDGEKRDSSSKENTPFLYLKARNLPPSGNRHSYKFQLQAFRLRIRVIPSLCTRTAKNPAILAFNTVWLCLRHTLSISTAARLQHSLKPFSRTLPSSTQNFYKITKTNHQHDITHPPKPPHSSSITSSRSSLHRLHNLETNGYDWINRESGFCRAFVSGRQPYGAEVCEMRDGGHLVLPRHKQRGARWQRL